MLNLELVASIQVGKQRRPDRTSTSLSRVGDSDHVPDYDVDDALASLKQRVHATITEGQTMLVTPVRIPHSAESLRILSSYDQECRARASHGEQDMAEAKLVIEVQRTKDDELQIREHMVTFYWVTAAKGSQGTAEATRE